MPDTSARLLRLLSLLPTRPAWTGPQLAQRLDVTVRTLRRDMVRLRDLGYLVDSVPGVAGGYRLSAGSVLPPLLLDDDEAVAIVLSLRTATGQTVAGIAETSLTALTKLEQVLPARLRQRAAALRLATVPLTGATTPVDQQILTVIAEACQRLHRLTFNYARHDGTTGTRTVEPYRLVHTGRRWYLVARDPERDGWRTFRPDRISDLRDTGTRFTPHPAPDAAAMVVESITTAPYRLRARVLIHAPAQVITDRVPPTVAIVEAIDDRTCLVVTGADSAGYLAMQLALLGHEFTVLEPAELITELGTLAARLERAHRTSVT